MARFNKTLKTIMEAMNTSSKEKTKAYDTPATVLRVDGDTLWVHIDGGVDETPIKRTIDAKVGDVVQVRVGGGRAWATGNASAPPTDDTKAGIALEQTNAVSKTVKTVKTLVDRVTKIAGDTAQYFWHTQQGTDTGVHITEIPKEDFLADPENGGGNLLARSNGIAVRDGLTELAQFGAGLARVGQEDDSNVKITEESVKMYKDGLECVSFELPSEQKTYIDEGFRNLYPITLETGDAITLFMPQTIPIHDGIDCILRYHGVEYKQTLTQQGGYDADDPSTYYYYSINQSDSQVTFYSNADREVLENEELDARFYVEEYSAPSYLGCYPKRRTDKPIMFAVGNGTPTTPSNAFEVDYYGKVNANGYTIDKTVSGNTHAAALQSWFNADNIVRNSLIPVYSSAYGNGSLCLGYFLQGYDTSPYGGFFVCHYNNARYVGIQNGTFTEYEITKTATSSRKTKENIKSMTEEEAKKLYDLNVISFDYKKEYEDGKKNQFGLIAEDCDEVIPYAVYKPDDSEDSIWGIDYVKFVPYLIKNLQLHEQKINELEKEIEFLKHNRRT